MTKRHVAKYIVLALLCLVCVFALAFGLGCGSSDNEVSDSANTGKTDESSDGGSVSGDTETALKDITGVTFPSSVVTYDGNEHTIKVSGDLPTGADVSYTGDTKGTNAGTYKADATISCEGYKTLVLSAMLTIEKADYDGYLSFENSNVLYNEGKVYEIEVEYDGELPAGTVITYSGNGVTDAGKHEVTATITFANYNTITLTAYITIVNVGGIAQSLVDDIMVTPSLWEYLPEALWPENMAYSSSPVSDFKSSSVSVSNIGTKAIGLQLEVVYSALSYADTVFGYVDMVLSVASTIAEVYQTYIDGNPDDYTSYEGSAGGFSLGIYLDGNNYTLLAGGSVAGLTISAEFEYNVATREHGGRVQLTNGIAAKYVYTDTTLQMDLSLTVAGVGYLYEIKLDKDGSRTMGYTYEYIGSSSISFPVTMAIFEAYSDYTYVYSLKRQNGDLYITGYEEIYSSTTGEYLGAEVGESMGGTYDTMWFMLGDVTGFNSVRMDSNDKAYVNGSSSILETKNYGGINLKTASRRYDIEYKTVYYVVGSDGSYTLTETQIPMLFVQYEKIDDFPSDIVSQNSGIFSVTPSLPTAVVTLLKNKYDVLQAGYEEIKDSVGYDSIMEFIGDNNEFFSKDTSD